MVAGNAVIASGTGGVADVLADGETGMLFPPEDFAALSKAMSDLAADGDRLAFYKKDVLLARAQLLEVLKDKRKAEVTAPVYTATNEWTPVSPAFRR